MQALKASSSIRVEESATRADDPRGNRIAKTTANVTKATFVASGNRNFTKEAAHLPLRETVGFDTPRAKPRIRRDSSSA